MKKVLITGAAGELGQGLLKVLLNNQSLESVVCVDLQSAPTLKGDSDSTAVISDGRVIWIKGSITDYDLIGSIIEKECFDCVFHLAALLSASAAKNPELAIKVNIEASQFLIKRTKQVAEQDSRSCVFIFPSSIAVYGLDQSTRSASVNESFISVPLTLYGKQKLEIELFGSNICSDSKFFSFRALRFPGIVSADSIPVGGTSDYASLMAHNSAQRLPYSCFVSAETTLSFLAMPDAISAMIKLAQADSADLQQSVYNLHGFNASALEIANFTKSFFPDADISFKVIEEKQQIVDSWPASLDCSAFSRDCEWNPELDKESAFLGYLLPRIVKFYQDEFK